MFPSNAIGYWLGTSYDTDTGEAFMKIEAGRRFDGDWFGELRMRALSGAEQGDTTYWLHKDDCMQLSLSRNSDWNL